jgi:predicted metal-binding membrane protein
MMVAMMVPSASPVILLFAETNHRRNEQQATFVGEKITPPNQLVSRLSGLLFIGWAAWIVFGS